MVSDIYELFSKTKFKSVFTQNDTYINLDTITKFIVLQGFQYKTNGLCL